MDTKSEISLRQTIIKTFGQDVLRFERFSLQDVATNIITESANYDDLEALELSSLLKVAKSEKCTCS